jgi:hypothetical protein
MVDLFIYFLGVSQLVYYYMYFYYIGGWLLFGVFCGLDGMGVVLVYWWGEIKRYFFEGFIFN